MLLRRVQPERRAGGLDVTYTVLVENQAARPVEVLLSGVVASIEGNPVSADCRAGSVSGRALALQVAGRSRIECRLRVSGNAWHLVTLGDRDLQLELPVRVGAATAVAKLSYWLRAEDAT